MKTTVIILSLFLICQFSVAQKKWKKLAFASTTAFVSGMLDGTTESISYHYEMGFKPRFKKANDQFWKPSESWKNKYKNGDPKQGEKFRGSTTSFVFVTDAYHLLRTSKRTLDGTTLVYFINSNCTGGKLSKKGKWKTAVKDFAIITAFRCIGFHTTYNFLFKVNKY
jgi:hypothetical protein